MNNIAPDPDTFQLPDGWRKADYAKTQQEKYRVLPSIRTLDGRVISQWVPNVEELAQLNAGIPLTLVLHTFNTPLQPIQLFVGGTDLREDS